LIDLRALTMPTYVVTGASSFIGRHLVPRLPILEDVQLRLLIHQNNTPALLKKDNVVTVQGDLLNLTTLRKLIVPDSIVINLAYLGTGSKADNLRAISNLVQACRDSKAKRLVHCSTATVVGKVSIRAVDENTPYNPVTAYEQIKHEIETFLLSADGVEVVILRPTAVFGPGGKNLIKLADSLMNGSTLVNYIKSCVHNERRMNAIYVDNVTACLSFLSLTDLNIDRQIFIISDDESSNNNYRFIETVLLRSFGRPDYFIPRVPVPSILLSIALRILGRSNDNPFRVYSSKKLINLGFKKPVSFELGLTKFAEWYKNQHLS
jgi:nucleoside-diphosphate-sugar epimerase